MEIIRLTDENLISAVNAAATILESGGIVLYPTDTIYGLAVDARNVEALGRLRELKGRDKAKPISVIVPDMSDIEIYAQMPLEARAIAERHLPGPLTLVLPGKSTLPRELMQDGQIGIRVPNDAFGRAVAKRLGGAITATSANRAGEVTHSSPERIVESFGEHANLIDLVIDAGERSGGVGSTVVTFANGRPEILREGVVSAAVLGI